MAYFPYGYEKVAAISDCWRINDTHKVHRWILDTLPDAVYYQGDMYLNDKEFVLLVLRFGPGKEEKTEEWNDYRS